MDWFCDMDQFNGPLENFKMLQTYFQYVLAMHFS